MFYTVRVVGYLELKIPKQKQPQTAPPSRERDVGSLFMDRRCLSPKCCLCQKNTVCVSSTAKSSPAITICVPSSNP